MCPLVPENPTTARLDQYACVLRVPCLLFTTPSDPQRQEGCGYDELNVSAPFH